MTSSLWDTEVNLETTADVQNQPSSALNPTETDENVYYFEEPGYSEDVSYKTDHAVYALQTLNLSISWSVDVSELYIIHGVQHAERATEPSVS